MRRIVVGFWRMSEKMRMNLLWVRVLWKSGFCRIVR